MQNLAKKFHTHFAFEENSLTGRLTARRPTALSLIREASGDALDLGAALFDAHWRAVAEARGKKARNALRRRETGVRRQTFCRIASSPSCDGSSPPGDGDLTTHLRP